MWKATQKEEVQPNLVVNQENKKRWFETSRLERHNGGHWKRGDMLCQVRMQSEVGKQSSKASMWRAMHAVNVTLSGVDDDHLITDLRGVEDDHIIANVGIFWEMTG